MPARCGGERRQEPVIPHGREVVIVDAVRTPIGRGHPAKGWYKDVHPADLLGLTYTEVIRRAGIDAIEVGDVVTGCVQQLGPQGFNIGRNAWLQEGLPIETPATTIDRQCGSAQQAVNFATALVASGARLITTLLHALEDDDKEIGLVTMCCGGGLGTGTLIQRL
jgi:acetyl-CoA acetyltransferase